MLCKQEQTYGGGGGEDILRDERPRLEGFGLPLGRPGLLCGMNWTEGRRTLLALAGRSKGLRSRATGASGIGEALRGARGEGDEPSSVAGGGELGEAGGMAECPPIGRLARQACPQMECQCGVQTDPPSGARDSVVQGESSDRACRTAGTCAWGAA